MANIFPKWTNKLPIQILVGGSVVFVSLIAGMTYYFTPKYTRVGYQPVQPVNFSHSIHADQLGLDCRYCHSQVENGAHSNLPTTQTCMNCHGTIKATSPLLAPVRDSYKSGQPIAWVRIHEAPDYVYFNHSAHVNRGISCVECHGKINEMPVVWHHRIAEHGLVPDLPSRAGGKIAPAQPDHEPELEAGGRAARARRQAAHAPPDRRGTQGRVERQSARSPAPAAIAEAA